MPESSPDRQPGATGPGRDGAATDEDLLACYRLLLARAPDPGGLEYYRHRLAAGNLSVTQLVGEFLGSVEFARAHPGHGPCPAAVEVVRTVEGFTICVDPTDYAVGHTVARTGAYEPGVSATLRRVLGPGGTFVDVGANIGWFSLLAASLVGPTGQVVAIEPNPASVALLRQSAGHNGFGNIQAINVALAERAMAVALETDGSNGRIIPVEGPPPEPVRSSWVVAARPLDDLLDQAGLGHVDVMKIDVEGAEPIVLRGAERLLRANRPVLLSEFFPLALDCAPWGSATSYLAMLRDHGYRLSVIDDDIGSGPGAVGPDVDDATLMAMVASLGRDHLDLLAVPA